MKINISQKQILKQSINLKLWIPILHSNIAQLNNYIDSFAQSNPFIEIKRSENLEDYYSSFNLDESSLISDILEQIDSSLFPTPHSQKIAYDILEDINEKGYFEGDIAEIAQRNNTTIESVEKIRKRFLYLDPISVGSIDLEESLLFQIDDLEIDDNIKNEFKNALKDFHIDNLIKASTKFSSLIKKLTFPPALRYLNRDTPIIVDFIITINNKKININYNDEFSPTIEINHDLKGTNKTINKKIQEAKNLVEVLALRKKTLHKIVFCLIEKQSDFFYNSGDLKPLSMKDIADELDFDQSTISRAVSNKYLEFNYKIYSLNSFFINTCGKIEVSPQTVKKLIQELLSTEEKEKPYSDETLRKIINEKLSSNLSRRVISKYRQSLNILSSTNRKKLYNL